VAALGLHRQGVQRRLKDTFGRRRPHSGPNLDLDKDKFGDYFVSGQMGLGKGLCLKSGTGLSGRAMDKLAK